MMGTNDPPDADRSEPMPSSPTPPKKVYQTPRLTVFGDLRTLTAMGGAGGGAKGGTKNDGGGNPATKL